MEAILASVSAMWVKALSREFNLGCNKRQIENAWGEQYNAYKMLQMRCYIKGYCFISKFKWTGFFCSAITVQNILFMFSFNIHQEMASIPFLYALSQSYYRIRHVILQYKCTCRLMFRCLEIQQWCIELI